MPRIEQYFAPVRRLTPSNAGYEAQQRLGQSNERTAEAWVQAARRFGALGTETAEMLKQTGALRRQDIEALKGMARAEPEPISRGGGIRIKGDPNQLLKNVHRADAINARAARAGDYNTLDPRDFDDAQILAARDVSRAAARLFAGSRPVKPQFASASSRSSEDQDFSGGVSAAAQDQDFSGGVSAAAQDQDFSGGVSAAAQDQDFSTPDASQAPGLASEIAGYVGGAISSWWDGLKGAVAQPPPAATTPPPGDTTTLAQPADIGGTVTYAGNPITDTNAVAIGGTDAQGNPVDMTTPTPYDPTPYDPMAAAGPSQGTVDLGPPTQSNSVTDALGSAASAVDNLGSP